MVVAGLFKFAKFARPIIIITIAITIIRSTSVNYIVIKALD